MLQGTPVKAGDQLSAGTTGSATFGSKAGQANCLSATG
jgi:hypothetical protein